MIIDAEKLDFKALNEQVRSSSEDVTVNNCLGQRFIGCGLNRKIITVNGIPGNALGAYLDGAQITVNGNAQDAVGDTMNDGRIIIHGNIGDAAGYAMRNGEIYVQGNAGYRAGIHMKAYKEKFPAIVIGGTAGSFLGEYQAGGIIIVLGLNASDPIVGNFTGTGMHGGKIFLRGSADDVVFPDKVSIKRAESDDLEEIKKYIDRYCEYFGADEEKIYSEPFYVLTPDSKNPYRQMYVRN